MLTAAATGTVSIFSALGVVSPPPPPLPPALTAPSTRSESTATVALPVAVSSAATPASVASRKRKRRDDGPGLPHSDLTSLGSIEGQSMPAQVACASRREPIPSGRARGQTTSDHASSGRTRCSSTVKSLIRRES